MNYFSNIIRSITLFCVISLWCIGKALFVPSISDAKSEQACTAMNETVLTECAAAISSSALSNATTAYPNQFIIGLESGISDEAVISMLDAQGLILKKRWKIFNGALVELNTSDKRQRKRAGISIMEQTRLMLELQPEVRYVEYNQQFTVEQTPTAAKIESAHHDSYLDPTGDFTPNDPEFSNQWALQTTRAVEGWGITQGDPDVVIAVIDSGYDLDHPDLGPSHLWVNEAEAAGQSGVDDDNNGYIDDINGWDFVADSNDISDDFGTGTARMGTIVATSNNELGISGIGRNIKVMPLKILESNGSGFIADLVDAIEYTAIVEEARIINLSVIIQFDSPTLAETITNISETKLLVANVGNVGGDVNWPAAYSETIAVASTDKDDNFASFSNRGPEVSLAAPDAEVLVLSYPADGVERQSDVSDTAYVSALAALIVSLRPDFSLEQIRSTMEQSAVDINVDEHPGVDNFVGHGRIDIYQALFNASAGLQIDPIPQPYETQPSIEDMVDLTVRVQTPITSQNTFPVQNVVVQYEFMLEDESATGTPSVPSVSGHVLTNAAGNATIVIPDLTDPENYLLRTTVGQASAEHSLADFSFQVKQKIWMPIVGKSQ